MDRLIAEKRRAAQAKQREAAADADDGQDPSPPRPTTATAAGCFVFNGRHRGDWRRRGVVGGGGWCRRRGDWCGDDLAFTKCILAIHEAGILVF